MASVAPSRTTPSVSQTSTTPTGSHPFTCISCAVAFRSSELQRNHMRTDWHRYNLQRRIASLPPLSAETFTEKVINAQANQTAAAAKAAFSKTCPACERTYYSENAYTNHLGSQKHRARAAAFENGARTETASVMSSTISLGEPIEIVAPENTDDPEVEAEFSKVIDTMKDASIADTSPVSRRPSHPRPSVSSEKPEHPLSPEVKGASGDAEQDKSMPINRCLFCNFDSSNLKANVIHMAKFHGMFVPEQEYLADPLGLIEYLQAKVTQNFECLYCHKLKYSLEAIQTHMKDKGHCMIAFDKEEELLEIGQFYDFRSTYSDEDSEAETDSDADEPNTSSRPGAKLGAARQKPVTRGPEEEDGEGWETDSDEENLESVASLPEHQVRRRVKQSKTVASEGFPSRSSQAAFAFEDELYLPSGRVAGHRSLNKYWRQNPRSYLSSEEKAQKALTEAGEANEDGEKTQKSALDKSLSTFRKSDRETMAQLAGNGENNQVALRQSLPSPALRAAVKKQRAQARKADKSENDYRARLEHRANNQKHFRSDVFGIRI